MTAYQKNISVVSRFIEDFLGKGDLAAADATAHATIKGITGLKPMGPIDGIEEYKAIVGGFSDAFPAVEPLKIIDQFASEDGTRIVTRFHSRQKHTKDFLVCLLQGALFFSMKRMSQRSGTEKLFKIL